MPLAGGGLDAVFSQTYEQARGRFMAAAATAGLDVQSHPHPLRGRDGEAVAMDVARDGPTDAAAVLIVSSACHGVEGFCGSGLQVALLSDVDVRRHARAAGVALLWIHGLNPWGFSWWRRTTHENVDLNRNFQDFSKPLPANPGYDEIAHLVVPTTWPPPPEVNAAVASLIATRGLPAMQQAITGGQHAHPQGLFYGGRDATWSQRVLRHVLADHGRRCARLCWIDVHTGLGPNGHGERIFACRDDAAALARARAWWGDAVTTIYDGSSSSAPLTGLMWLAAYDECPQAEYTGIALEFGTEPLVEVIDALRGDQWLENHPHVTDPAVRDAIKRRLRDAFYTDQDGWKQQVLAQGRDAVQAAVDGLGGLGGVVGLTTSGDS